MVIFKMETESSTMSMGKVPSTVATVGLGSFGEAITSNEGFFFCAIEGVRMNGVVRRNEWKRRTRGCVNQRAC